MLEESLFHEPDGSAEPVLDSSEKMIGKYRILKEIGKGGMGRVYLAERADGHFKQRVALKVIPRSDPDLQARVVAETELQAREQERRSAELDATTVIAARNAMSPRRLAPSSTTANSCSGRRPNSVSGTPRWLL